ncbi:MULTISPECIES: type II toxin-antitoxin system VapC family toxin [unclassified Pseudonocardia]|uniref:type II toxin-antitoxin system VapC family toxin n=1 Tax=unclassified Pseudonocardia TaxID=2619320 RepID=UPI001CF62746|nr:MULTISPECIES: type II toxin-antitoxin system VapC family toxin [unclassified Pseudonocardia]
MVIDTSALVAILFDEPPRPALARAIEADPVRLVSAATVLEAAMVVESRRGDAAGRELDILLHRAQVRTVDVGERHAELARSVWRRYGKGRHPAGLNYGDCFSAALALASGEPLLFVGDDFARTDIPSVALS